MKEEQVRRLSKIIENRLLLLSNFDESRIFDVSFDKHASEIYDNPQWPESPLFYVNFPSITDNNMAPEGCENCFILIPIAPDLKDNKEIRNKYLNIVLKRIEDIAGEKISEVKKKKTFCAYFCTVYGPM